MINGTHPSTKLLHHSFVPMSNKTHTVKIHVIRLKGWRQYTTTSYIPASGPGLRLLKQHCLMQALVTQIETWQPHWEQKCLFPDRLAGGFRTFLCQKLPCIVLISAVITNSLYGRCRVSANTHHSLSKLESNLKNCDANQKQRMPVFRVEVVPYSCTQHMSKGSTFTLNVNSLTFQFVYHISYFHSHLASSQLVFRDTLMSYMQKMGTPLATKVTRKSISVLY